MDKEHKEESKIKDKKIEKLTKENEKLKLEVERLKNQNKKDSSNSNKTSGTNGFKKVILNSYYAHFDESQIKVDGNSFNEVCVSNSRHTRMWTMKCKKHGINVYRALIKAFKDETIIA